MPFRPARLATPPRRGRTSREGSPAIVPVFNADDSSSYGNTDDEPTQEIEAKARKTFLSDEIQQPPPEPTGDDSTLTVEENDATIVDPPRTFDHDLAVERGLAPRGRRR